MRVQGATERPPGAACCTADRGQCPGFAGLTFRGKGEVEADFINDFPVLRGGKTMVRYKFGANTYLSPFLLYWKPSPDEWEELALG